MNQGDFLFDPDMYVFEKEVVILRKVRIWRCTSIPSKIKLITPTSFF